ncbi:putative cinnamoyl-CoA reductase [Xylaria sp. FL1042]|nr:putative cinnamoyl-CoA reductase [Xylaria sp. FL1042]
MTALILITGATGLIGFRILLAALEAGHAVRYTARSEEKALVVASNPSVRKLAPRDRLSPVIIPDLTVDGALDNALQDVTHVIHAGSPVPNSAYDPTTQVFQPTMKMTPSVQRVIITSSIVGNLPLGPPQETPVAVSASTRVPLPNPPPSTFDNLYEAYVFEKIVELHNSDEFVKTNNPHFTVSHVAPAWVFGRNELALDADMMQTQNSSNNLVMMGMVGGEPPLPLHNAFVHVGDVADVHLKVAFLDPQADGPKDFGIANKVDYGTLFDHVEKSFRDAVTAGVFKKGRINSQPIAYDSSAAEQLLGRKFKTFETAVVDVASQYLEKISREKA